MDEESSAYLGFCEGMVVKNTGFLPDWSFHGGRAGQVAHLPGRVGGGLAGHPPAWSGGGMGGSFHLTARPWGRQAMGEG